MKKHVRFSCLLLSIVMLLSLLSVSAFAAETPEGVDAAEAVDAESAAAAPEEVEAETPAAPEEAEAEAPSAPPEEGDAEEPAAAPEEPEAEAPAAVPQEDAVPLADEEEPPQTTPELTIEGYTRVTEMPENGLAAGKYLIVAEFEGKYYMLYPGDTGVAATAKNSARLVVNADGEATGYQVGCGTAYDEAKVSTDFSAADNAIAKGKDTYTIAANQFAGGEVWNGYTVYATSPAGTRYYLFGGNGYGASIGTTLIGVSSVSGYFRLRNTGNNNAHLIFYKAGKDTTNYNFNQSGGCTENTDGYTVDIMLFMSEIPYEPVPEQAAPVIPGYTQLTDITSLDETKGYLIVSQDSEGNFFALYPSEDGEIIAAGNLVQVDVEEPDMENVGARTAALTVAGNTVSAKWLKNGSAIDMTDLLFTINECDGGYLFTAFNGRHLNMSSYMFTEGLATLTLTNRGFFTDNAFQIKNATRNLDFTKTGDPKAFFTKAGHSVNTWGTDFWSPTGSYSLPVYLYASNVTAPTAKSRLAGLIESIGDINNDDGKYISLSWKTFYTQFSDAKALLTNSELTNENASEFFNAWGSLEAAYNALLSSTPPADATKLDAKDMIPASGTTKGEPFAFNTAGSNKFRIPAIITLQHQKDESRNGRLVAAIDARWNHTGDACGLDTIASYSDDNGANWNYNFPNYFGDSIDAKATYATAFIDPVMVEGLDGTIYLMVDLWPGGVALNTAPMKPAASTGYVDIDGEQRLALYISPVTGSQTNNNYAYYVDDFTDGYAPVMERTAGENGDTYSFSGFYVDKYYYLYSTNGTFGAKTPASDKIWCKRLGSDEWVQQNVFFYNAVLHARNASYLWIVTSTDGGETWSEPQMINDQVRTGKDQFYGVGPGAGLCMEDGTILLPVYIWSNEHAGFIYSKDNGATWKRSDNYATVANNSSSESCLIQLDENTVRHFYRESWNRDLAPVAYTDHTWNGTGWEAGEIVRVEDAVHWGACQVSAIKYSEQIEGKDVILYSAPAGGNRVGGVIHVFLINDDKDHTMTLYNTYKVNEESVQYAYSSLTETSDGSIALLYESTNDAVIYKIIPLTDLNPSLTATDYKGSYDGKGHSITVIAPTGGKFEYSTDDGETWVDENPAFTEIGTYAVKVKWTFGERTEEASATVVISRASSGGSGGGGGSTANTETTTTTNPDGSTTTTVTDKTTGTVTETTEKEDGSVDVVETKKDGTVTATSTDADGGKVEKVTTPEKDVTITATDSNGEVLAKVEIPAEIPAPETRFEDVPEGHWADEAIHNMATLEIVNGVGGNTFNSNGSMKRGDLALLLSRMSNAGAGSETSFTDVPSDMYYAAGVAWATKTGVVTGRGENTFAPEDSITREELAVMLHRYAKLLKLDTQADTGALNGFADGSNTHSWAQEGMAWCVSRGILQGKGGSVLDPGTNVTRAEVAVMIQRFMNLMK